MKQIAIVLLILTATLTQPVPSEEANNEKAFSNDTLDSRVYVRTRGQR